jgi:hypothetical protein
MIAKYRSKRKEKNSVELRPDFVSGLLPGIQTEDKKEPPKDWLKYFRIAISVIRLAEYDYLDGSDEEAWKSAKVFLFGRNTLFTQVCEMFNINTNMARMKLIAYKKAHKTGDPIFESISKEYADKYSLALSPTSKDIQEII